VIDQPIALLGVILVIAALAFWLEGRFGWARRAGASLIIIALGALLSNLDLVPVASPVYAAITGPVTSFAIVWLLLAVNLRDVVRAGPRMLGAFGLAVVSTAAGAVTAALLFGHHFPGDAWRLAGVLTGTYAGGSVNFVAIGREVGLSDSLFAAAAAADNLVTAVWVGATLMLPLWLARVYPPRDDIDAPAGSPARPQLDYLAARARDLLALGALAVAVTITAESIALRAPSVPSVLWLTTLALAAGQLPAVRRLEGAFQLGLLALNLFFAVIGIGSRVSEILAVGIEVLYFTATVVLVHGLLMYGVGRLLPLGLRTLSVASQAAVGGPSTALALTVARGWGRLALPAVLVGLLGYAVGNYAGLAVAALVARLGG
jgi:uncharacterized membrane protein